MADFSVHDARNGRSRWPISVFTMLRFERSRCPDPAVHDRPISALESVVPPTGLEQTPYPSRPDLRRFDQVVRFATISPVKAGWLLKSKGRWSITESGTTALDRFADPEALMRESIRLYGEWKATREEESVGPTPYAQPESAAVQAPPPAFEDAEGAAWDEIQSHIAGMDPYDFQKLVAALLAAMGYHIAWVAPPGPDHGVDVIAYADPLGAKDPCVKVSVRRRTTKTDVKDVREFMSVLHGTDLGLFVSMSGFTKPAEDLARTDQRKIRLFDLEKLFDLWVEHYDKVEESSKMLLPLRPIYFLAPQASD